MSAREPDRRWAVLLLVLAATGLGCGSTPPDVVGPEPRPHHESRWLAPNVRYLVTSGEPMFVVDGRLWLWRGAGWLRWHGDGWRWAAPPPALEELPSHLEGR